MQLSRHAFALALLAVMPQARAEQSPGAGVRLSFVRAENAADCIAAAALEGEIAHRMGRDPFVGPTRQWIEGTVWLENGSYEVRLFESDREGRTIGTRRLHEIAGDCRKLDDAIELAIALIIDPTAQLAPRAQVAPRALPLADGQAPAPRSPMASAPRASQLLSQQEPDSQQRRAGTVVLSAQHDAQNQIQPRRGQPVRDSGKRQATAFVAADAVVVSGVLPRVAAGLELATRVSLGRSKRFALRLATLYLPEKRDLPATSDLGSSGKFAYGLTAFEAGACALAAWRRAIGFGCGSLSAGAIHAVVLDPTPFDPGDRFWLALRIEAGLALRIAGPVWAELRAFDLVTPRRWNFQTKTEAGPRSVFRQQWLMPGAALGLGLQFD